MENAPKPKPHVIIVGAGFGGLEAAKLLIDEPVRMTVIDRTNHHLFQPLLYQIATAALSPADIAAPIRGILGRCKNTEVILAEVKSVNVEARTVNIGEREIARGAPDSAHGDATAKGEQERSPRLGIEDPVIAEARAPAVIGRDDDRRLRPKWPHRVELVGDRSDDIVGKP